jgi:hypothetical protein
MGVPLSSKPSRWPLELHYVDSQSSMNVRNRRSFITDYPYGNDSYIPTHAWAHYPLRPLVPPLARC